jgi:hypothetical protein
MVTLSPPNYPHLRLSAIYEAARTAYTADKLRVTAKPRKKKVRQKEVEALKHRVESVEGSEVPEIAFNEAEMGLGSEKAVSEGDNKVEDSFAMDTAAIPAQGFQGA